MTTGFFYLFRFFVLAFIRQFVYDIQTALPTNMALLQRTALAVRLFCVGAMGAAVPCLGALFLRKTQELQQIF